MKKLSIAIALALLITASAAHAAVFTFTSQPADIGNFSINGGDVTATFTNFSYLNPSNDTLYDYYMGASSGATISFSPTAILQSIAFVDWNPEQPITGVATLGSTTFLFNSTTISQIYGKIWDSVYLEGTFGITEVVASATPLPGAALLLGSGLVGLIGLRRRFRQ